MTDHDLRDATLVGFSMGGGDVARYIGNHGEDRLHSVVFASAVPPYLLKTDENPDGPLTKDAAADFESNLRADRDIDWGRAMAVMGELNRAGFTRISLVTNSSSGDSVPGSEPALTQGSAGGEQPEG